MLSFSEPSIISYLWQNSTIILQRKQGHLVPVFPAQATVRPQKMSPRFPQDSLATATIEMTSQ